MLKRFSSNGVHIAFIDVAPQNTDRGEPILLIHGFGSNHKVNWVNPRWVDTLTRDGRRVIALDNRGHGDSDKLYAPADYRTDRMAQDSANLLAHLSVARADVMGYSMGARIGAFLTLGRPDLVRSLVIGGLGDRLVDGAGLPMGIAEAMEAPSLDGLTDPMQRMFRAFADQTKSDRRALAACIRGSRQSLTEGGVAQDRDAGAGGGRDARPGRRRCASARGDDAQRRGARHSGARPQRRGRRPGLQGGGAGVP